MMPTMRLGILALLFVIGCGKDPGVGDDQPPMDAPSTPDAYVPPDGYTKLIGRTWNLALGARDIYRCARLTVPQDMYITNIQAQAPDGTHHTVLSIASAGTAGPDGEYDCRVDSLGMVMLYASGVGTSPLDFPQDVGIKISAGQQVHLNLHLYNSGDEALSGESAIWVKAQATPPPTLAEMVFVGPLQFTIQPDTIDPSPQIITRTCDASTAYTLFAIWPHMHKLATHQKLELAHTSGTTTTTTTLHDMPYTFFEQRYWLKSPLVQVAAGDRLTVTCSYDNMTGAPVSFGDSSDKEMCFSGLYRYPARGSSLFECPF